MTACVRASAVVALLAPVGFAFAFPPNVRAVNPAAAAGGNGQSWAQAYTSLQSALDEAAGSGGAVTEIWLAGGVYRPTRERAAGMPESRTFEIPDGVGIFGGFSGFEEARGERDAGVNLTLLTGEGLSVPPYHVVRFESVGGGTVLDGVQVSGGIASGVPLQDRHGGGVLVVSGEPRLVGCTISGNQGLSGAGLAVESGAPELIGCRVRQNTVSSAGMGGGGVLVLGGTLTMRQCVVQQNAASGPVSGGGMAVHGGDVVMDRTRFISNTCDTGGAFSCASGSVAATNSLFRANAGGLAGQNLTLTNCTIIDNMPVKIGSWSGVNGSGVLTNCIVWGNCEPWAAGIAPQAWGTLEVRYSCIAPNSTGPQLAGVGLSREDPLLDAEGRIGAFSRCIDAGMTVALGASAVLDLGGGSRVVDDLGTPNTGPGVGARVDVGAFEFQGETCFANCDRSVVAPVLTVADFSCFLSKFAAGDPLANCDDSGPMPQLNVGDFTCFLQRFARGCP